MTPVPSWPGLRHRRDVIGLQEASEKQEAVMAGEGRMGNRVPNWRNWRSHMRSTFLVGADKVPALQG